MSEIVRVRMADYKLCSPPERITTVGLGSCLGVVICDKVLGLCGMAHVMLPDSTRLEREENRLKFVDTCLGEMLENMLQRGADRSSMYAKIAGGASMFSFDSENANLHIGEQNIEAVRKFLKKNQIPIVAEHVGDNFGRTIVFTPEDGLLHVTAIGIGDFVI